VCVFVVLITYDHLNFVFSSRFQVFCVQFRRHDDEVAPSHSRLLFFFASLYPALVLDAPLLRIYVPSVFLQHAPILLFSVIRKAPLLFKPAKSKSVTILFCHF
jgi:hypothetical protein